MAALPLRGVTSPLPDMILVIDNYDSFVFNLVQYLGELGVATRVVRNDRISVAEARRLRPEALLISPGPCTPAEAGVSLEMIRALAGEFPILGVCLGHQAIGAAFGGAIVRAPRVMHGKTSQVRHDRRTLFDGLPDPLQATRYHSLVVRRECLPDVLEASAWTEDGLIMGLRHRTLPIEGVQFHPESVLTPSGLALLANFLRYYCGRSAGSDAVPMSAADAPRT